jgi:aldehyde dehydrogenase (NAD+)
VKAARAAFEGDEWSKMQTSDRGKLMTKLADLMDENSELLAHVESLDNGKSLQFARIDIRNASGCIRYYGGYADKIHGKVIDTGHGTLNYTRHEPVGVCGQIIP